MGATLPTGGVAYVFQPNAITGMWSQNAALKPADGAAGDGFANSLSLYRERITGYEALLLGAGAPNAAKGYIIVLDPRVNVWKFSGSAVGSAGSMLGQSVSSYENMVAFGAPGSTSSVGVVTTFIAVNVSNTVGWVQQSVVSALTPRSRPI